MTMPASGRKRSGTTYNYSVQNGTQRSKGIEADLNASPVSGLNNAAGYAYNDSKMEEADRFTKGRRPVKRGS